MIFRLRQKWLVYVMAVTLLVAGAAPALGHSAASFKTLDETCLVQGDGEGACSPGHSTSTQADHCQTHCGHLHSGETVSSGYTGPAVQLSRVPLVRYPIPTSLSLNPGGRPPNLSLRPS